MVSDEERRQVAERLRDKKAECEERGYPWMCDDLILALGYDHDYEAGDEIFDRLADLIDPGTTSDTTTDTTKSAEDTTKAPNSHPNLGTAEANASQVPECDMSQSRRDTVASDPTERGIDSIYEWCRERLEGADGAEDELYCSIMRAIEDYRHPELVTARTVRAVDRDALLALAVNLDARVAELIKVNDLDQSRQRRSARRAHAMDLMAACSRIREACGVVA